MIPIFVIVKDRLQVLKQSVKSWIDLMPVDIVFIDNGSTFEPTVAWLKKVEKSHPVYWNKAFRNSRTEFCNGFAKIINDHLSKNPSNYYIVSDPDIMFDKTVDDDILDVFKFLLKKTKATCVGPSLRIDDIPDFYPFKKQVLIRHKKLWSRDRNTIKFHTKQISYKQLGIDTTFAMYRNGFNFRRHNLDGLRVYKPYVARHLDWYLNPAEMTLDQVHYAKNAHGISHWSIL